MTLYTTTEAAEALGCDRSTVTRAAKRLSVGRRHANSLAFTAADVRRLRGLVRHAGQSDVRHGRRTQGRPAEEVASRHPNGTSRLSAAVTEATRAVERADALATLRARAVPGGRYEVVSFARGSMAPCGEVLAFDDERDACDWFWLAHEPDPTCGYVAQVMDREAA